MDRPPVNEGFGHPIPAALAAQALVVIAIIMSVAIVTNLHAVLP